MKKRNTQVADTDTGDNIDENEVKPVKQKKKTKFIKGNLNDDEPAGELFNDLKLRQNQSKLKKRKVKELRKKEEDRKEKTIIEQKIQMIKPKKSKKKEKENRVHIRYKKESIHDKDSGINDTASIDIKPTDRRFKMILKKAALIEKKKARLKLNRSIDNKKLASMVKDIEAKKKHDTIGNTRTKQNQTDNKKNEATKSKITDLRKVKIEEETYTNKDGERMVFRIDDNDETQARRDLSNEPYKLNEGFAYERYNHIIEINSFMETDIKWDIWLGTEGEDQDEIIWCELWMAATHQLCYGKELIHGIPQDNWFWERWEQLVSKLNHPKDIKWALWGESKGILTRFYNQDENKQDVKDVQQSLVTINQNNHQDFYDSDQDDFDKFYPIISPLEWGDKISKWAHISCINWTSNINFIDDEQYVVEGQIQDYQKGHTWYICNRSNFGAYIKCDFDESWQKHFHARCAMRKGIIKSLSMMENQVDPKNVENYILFWETHYQDGIKKIEEMKIKLKKQKLKQEIKNED